MKRQYWMILICVGLLGMISIPNNVHASPVSTPIIEQTFVNSTTGCSESSATSFLQNDLFLAFLSMNSTSTTVSPVLGGPQGAPTMNGFGLSQFGYTRTLSNIAIFEYWMVFSTAQASTTFACSLNNTKTQTSLLLLGIKNANQQSPLENLNLGAPYNSGGGTTPSLYLNTLLANTLLVSTVASCANGFNSQTPAQSWTNENSIAATTSNCPSNGWYLETNFANATSAIQTYSAIGNANEAQWASLGAIVNPVSGSIGGGGPQPQIPFQSVQGPGGYPIPRQLADSNVLNFIGILAAVILLSAIPIKKREKKKNSFTG